MMTMTDTTDSTAASTAQLPSVEILFFDGFDELDAVGPWEVLSAAGFGVRPVGWPGDRSTVVAAHGLRIGVDGPISDAPGLLLVPGGGWVHGTGVRHLVEEGALPARVAQLHAAGTILASVCTGGLVLAEAGLLRGRPAVTNRLALDALRAYGADVRDDARVVDDGDIVTCGGPLMGIDLALRLVDRWLGPEAALAAAGRIEHERRGPLVLTGGSGAPASSSTPVSAPAAAS
jgi:transcriptional regulator GlxA family with amidase domain